MLSLVAVNVVAVCRCGSSTRQVDRQVCSWWRWWRHGRTACVRRHVDLTRWHAHLASGFSGLREFRSASATSAVIF